MRKKNQAVQFAPLVASKPSCIQQDVGTEYPSVAWERGNTKGL